MSELDETLERELSALLDGALSPEREAELRALVARSPELAVRLEALRRVDAALRSLPVPAASPDLRARLDARLRAEAGSRRGRAAPGRRGRWLAAAGVGAALAAAAALALVLVRQPAPGPTPAPEAGPSLIAGVPDEDVELAMELPPEDLGMLEDLDLLLSLDALDKGTRG